MAAGPGSTNSRARFRLPQGLFTNDAFELRSLFDGRSNLFHNVNASKIRRVNGDGVYMVGHVADAVIDHGFADPNLPNFLSNSFGVCFRA